MSTPKRVTITRSFTYDVDSVGDTLERLQYETPTIEEVLDIIYSIAVEDHSKPLGEDELVITDADTGEEL